MSTHNDTGSAPAPDTRMLVAEREERERLRIYQSAREAGAVRVLAAIIARQSRERES